MAHAAAQSRMTTVGILSLSSALAMDRPVSSGLPSVSTTLKVMPCTCVAQIGARRGFRVQALELQGLAR